MEKQSTTPPSSDLQLDGNHLPSQAAAVHETIRADGEKELTRTVSALFWSALAAGLSMSFSMLARACWIPTCPIAASLFWSPRWAIP